MRVQLALLTQLPTVWTVVGTAATPSQESGSVRLIRTYGEGKTSSYSELLDLSNDGGLLLSNEVRFGRCPNGKPYCRFQKLVVHDTKTGQRIGELPSQAGGMEHFLPARFGSGRTVLPLGAEGRIEWNPFTGEIRTVPLKRRGSRFCLMDDGRVLALSEGKSRDQLNLISEQAGSTTLSNPDSVHGRGPERDFDCRGWSSGQSFLFQGSESDRRLRLYWISASPNVPYRACWTQPDRYLYGYAVSPDGTLAVAITGSDDGDKDEVDTWNVISPKQRIFLNVIQAGTCENLLRTELQFPHEPKVRATLLAPKNKYYANALLSDALAKRVAVSPDNTMVAISYGIRTGGVYSSAVGYFGIYSLLDGRRLATLKGDVLRNGPWQAIRYGEWYATRWAPAEAIFFSPDSKTVYASSFRVWQWDISGLR